RPHVGFGCEVTRATYDADAQGWVVEARRADGTTVAHRADVVISAVGAFNKPKTPPIPGADSFAGPVAHTARWPKDGIDVHGRRVGVIGNGASAMQLVPAIADQVESVVVFQRSPQWAAPFDKFHQPVPAALRLLLREVP